jgi:hypothetical protein
VTALGTFHGLFGLDQALLAASVFDIYLWTGVQWLSLDANLEFRFGQASPAWGFAKYDNTLIAGGSFRLANGVRRLASYEGGSWVEFASVDHDVHALTVHGGDLTLIRQKSTRLGPVFQRNG